jgi:hypothetical protein
MLLTSIKQLCVRFRSGDQAVRRRRIRHMPPGAADVPESRLMLVATPRVSFFKSIVLVSAALTLFLASRGRARADFITMTGQPTFQTVESASDATILNNVVQPALTQTFTTPAAGTTTNSFTLLNIAGSATASVDNGYNSSPSSLADYVLLSSSVSADAGDYEGVYQYLAADAESSANLQGATFTLNQPASAVLTFAPTLSIGSQLISSPSQDSGAATVAVQGNNGSVMQISAQEQGLDGILQSSTIYGETVTAGPSSIQTFYDGADSVEMNLAPGTYTISGSSQVFVNFESDSNGFISDLSVSGGAELVLDALGGPPAPTPEPATLTLLSSGLFGFGGWRLWRKRRGA